MFSQLRALSSLPREPPDRTGLTLNHALVQAGREHFLLPDETLRRAFITPSAWAMVTDRQQVIAGFLSIEADFRAALWISYGHRIEDPESVRWKTVILRTYIRVYRLQAKGHRLTRKIGIAIKADRLEATERLATQAE